MSFLRLASRSTAVYRSAVAARALPNRFVLPRATYASGSGLSRDAIQSRIFEVLKGNEKVDPAKVCTPRDTLIATLLT